MDCRWRAIVTTVLALLLPLLPAAAAGGAESGAAATPSAEGPAGVLPAKAPITYTYLINENPNFSMVQDGAIMEYFRQKTNVRLLYQGVPNETFKEKFNIIVASGTVPDICGGGNHAEIYGPKGLFLNLNNYKQYAPNFMKLANDPKYSVYLRVSDGGIYHMPRIIADDVERLQYMLQYRKDILDELKMQEPDTYEGWYELFKAVKAKYPDMIPYSFAKDNWRFNISAWGFWVADGMLYDAARKQWFYSPITENHKAAIEYHRKLYAERLLDQEFLSTTRNDMVEKLMAGKLFSCISHGWTANPASDTKKKRDAGDTKTTFDAAVPPKTQYAPRTIPSATPVYSYDSDKVVSFSSKIKNPEVAIAFFDYISYSQEGSLTLRLGLEGTHWKMESYGPDRTAEQTQAYLAGKSKVEDMGGSDRIPVLISMYTWFPGAMKNFKQITASDPAQKQLQYTIDKALPYIDNRPVPPVRLFMSSEEVEKAAELQSRLSTIYLEYRIKFITGKAPMSDWDKYLADLKKGGYEELVKLYNGAQAKLDAAVGK